LAPTTQDPQTDWKEKGSLQQAEVESRGLLPFQSLTANRSWQIANASFELRLVDAARTLRILVRLLICPKSRLHPSAANRQAEVAAVASAKVIR
jgi:hypothetical protein